MLFCYLLFLYDPIISAIAILTSVLNLNIILNFHILSSFSTKMVRTRSQLENPSKEELIEELIKLIEELTDVVSSKLSALSNRFIDFLRRFEVVLSDLAITRNCNISK